MWGVHAQKRSEVRVCLDVLSEANHSNPMEYILLRLYGFAYHVWSPVLAIIHSDSVCVRVFVCGSVFVCVWLDHRLFSLCVCVHGLYSVLEQQGEEGLTLSTSRGPWERLAAICDLCVTPQLSQVQRDRCFVCMHRQGVQKGEDEPQSAGIIRNRRCTSMSNVLERA